MRKYFLSVLALVLSISACDKSDLSGSLGKSDEISFVGYVQRNVSKASSPYEKPIYVSSIFGTVDEAAGSMYFRNALFEYNVDRYASSTSIFWPFGNDDLPRHLDFYAVSSKDNALQIKHDEEIPYLEVAGLSGDNDIVVSTLFNKYHSTEPVFLPFAHTLTKVAFKLSSDDNSIKYVIKNINLKAYSNAKYRFKTTTTLAAWTQANTDSQNYNVLNSEVVLDYNATQALPVEKELLLLPNQPSADNSVTVTVEYEAYYLSAANNEVAVFNGSRTADLSSLISTDWGMNKSVVYTLKLSAGKAMSFTSESAPWADPVESEVQCED